MCVVKYIPMKHHETTTPMWYKNVKMLVITRNEIKNWQQDPAFFDAKVWPEVPETVRMVSFSLVSYDQMWMGFPDVEHAITLTPKTNLGEFLTPHWLWPPNPLKVNRRRGYKVIAIFASPSSRKMDRRVYLFLDIFMT